MMADPVAIPQVVPVVEPTVAMVGSLLLHVPPLEAFVRVMQEPIHIAGPPLIGPGPEVTVIVFVTWHVPPNE